MIQPKDKAMRFGTGEIMIDKNVDYYNKNAKPGSLASKANMVQLYNDKNDKSDKKNN